MTAELNFLLGKWQIINHSLCDSSEGHGKVSRQNGYWSVAKVNGNKIDHGQGTTECLGIQRENELHLPTLFRCALVFFTPLDTS